MTSFPDYIQAVLTEPSHEKLVSVLDGGKFPKKYMHHVTLAYKPDQAIYKSVVFGKSDTPIIQDGQPVKIIIGRYVYDDEYGLDVVTATIVTEAGIEVQSANTYDHITISTTDERKPVDSNTLLKRVPIHKFEDVPLILDGIITFGYFNKRK